MSCSLISSTLPLRWIIFFFFQAEDGIRDLTVTGVQTCALPIYCHGDDRQLGHQTQQLVAMAVPRARLAQVQAHCHAVAHAGALAAEGVQRADGSSELDAQRPFARLVEAKPAAAERRRPARDLQ